MTLVGLLNEGGLGISMNHGWLLINRNQRRQRGKSANECRQFLSSMTFRVVSTPVINSPQAMRNKHKHDCSMKHCYPAIFWRNYEVPGKAGLSSIGVTVSFAVLALAGIPA
jgi:hypothetical protein